MKINTIRYVFENSKPDLRRLVVKYGLPPAKNDGDLYKKVNYIVAKFKAEAMKDIALLHPDRELIVWSMQSDKKDEETGKITQSSNDNLEMSSVNINRSNMKNFSGACGCSGADGENDYSNCNGNKSCGCGCDEKSKTSNAGGNEASGEVVVVKKSLGDMLKENMPVVIIGSLILVGIVAMTRTAPKI